MASPDPSRHLVPTARKVLTNISARAWEHPTDRATLQALRAIPGFDEVVRKVFGILGERGVRLLFQANAVRVGASQLPRLHQLFTDVLATLDWPERPELYVTQTPIVNAGAFGMDRPFIVINSGTLELLDDDELRAVLGHELGHIMSGHALYHTILVLLLNLGLSAVPVAGMAIVPIQLALLEWYRKSELSCDRAAMLGCQDRSAALRVFMKMAGGRSIEANLDAFLAQAREYEDVGGVFDRVFKKLNTLGQSHPFHTLRAADLDRWLTGGHYDRILSGDYPRRDEDSRPYATDFAEAKSFYVGEAVKEARAVMTDVAAGATRVVDGTARAVQALGEALKKRVS